MYDQLDFAKVNITKATTYSGLIKAVKNQFTYSNEMVDLGEIRISEVGTLLWRGHEARLTKPAFVKFCKRLRIPDPFAKFIPWDLLRHNINLLAGVVPDAVQIFQRDDGSIVNTATGTFVPCDHITFLEAIKKSSPTIKRATLTDINMEIDIISPIFGEGKQFVNIEPKKGDIIETGINFNNSTCGHNFTMALLFLLRLVCTNGMTLPTRLGFAKMRTKQGRDLKISVDNFISHVENMGINALALRQEFKDLDRSLISSEFSKCYKGLDKIIRDKEYQDAEIFEIDSSDRQLFMANARSFKKDPETEIIPISVNGFKVLNNITLKAKEFEQVVRRKMEAYAGKMLTGAFAEA